MISSARNYVPYDARSHQIVSSQVHKLHHCPSTVLWQASCCVPGYISSLEILVGLVQFLPKDRLSGNLSQPPVLEALCNLLDWLLSTEATKAGIMQEYTTYVDGIWVARKKIREETLLLVEEIFGIDDTLNGPSLFDGLINEFSESSHQYLL